MKIKSFLPKTPGTRHRTRIHHDYGQKIIIRKLQIHKQTKSKSGGNFINYKLIDFKHYNINVPGIIIKFVYDSYRSAVLMLVVYNNGYACYKLAVNGLKKGDKIETGTNKELKIGNTVPLNEIPPKMKICQIQTEKGVTLCRAAGSYASIIRKQDGYALIALKSGIFKMIPLNFFATIGEVANIEHKNVVKGKAGVSRWEGRRPKVRGMAQNPVDHPSTPGKQPKTSTGKLARGVKTRKKPINYKHFFKVT